MRDALEVGYRSIDTAQSYFNEEEVGKAIEKSEIDRKEIFLTESSKSPASIAKSNKQWVGTCLYQEECKLLLIKCGAVIGL